MEELVQAIMAVDPRIRHVGIFDSGGEALVSMRRPSASPLVPAGRLSTVYRRRIQMVALAQAFETFTGATEYVHVRWQRVQAYYFPYGEHVVLLTAEHDFPEEAVVKILHLLRPSSSPR